MMTDPYRGHAHAHPQRQLGSRASPVVQHAGVSKTKCRYCRGALKEEGFIAVTTHVEPRRLLRARSTIELKFGPDREHVIRAHRAGQQARLPRVFRRQGACIPVLRRTRCATSCRLRRASSRIAPPAKENVGGEILCKV